MAFRFGDRVQIKGTLLPGKVADTQYNKEAEALEHLVEYVDAEGAAQQRWFLESQLVGV
ncbi:MAG: hypothetical protein AB1513_11400 [Pseudomonadota bacterium]